ncbi:hypothetical protein KJS94_15520 [Flavihumibacter rivuli]|uniref:hypothetical protein n=1 Tax=Flavihumibacter rivuli TaxID=2838156 RepID=UPI001BDF3FE5|nr:hypothetical protein [Flavihumibacter rivuli]ULQ56057.1 hypothetical protein KJS94_15520 [Flavihumibacter rivuli]
MKKILTIGCLAFSILGYSQQSSTPEYLGLPGDNLNLYALLKLFRNAPSPVAFQDALNRPSSLVNNLDLNNDGVVDIIRVIPLSGSMSRMLVLRTAINANESQDIAVITVSLIAKDRAQVQVAGDPLLYGKEYIIEPNYETGDDHADSVKLQKQYKANTTLRNGEAMNEQYTSTYGVAQWPVVKALFGQELTDLPAATGAPLAKPYYWHQYYAYHFNWYHEYYSQYRRWSFHRLATWKEQYVAAPPASSTFVANRIRSGGYMETYSKPEKAIDGIILFNQKHPELAAGAKVPADPR